MADRPRSAQWRARARRVRYGVYLVLGLLAVQFFRMQVLRSHSYALQSEENRLRAITVPPARGAIYDRDGRIVAENVPGYAVSILPSPPDTVRATLERLAPYLEIGPEERERLLERYRERGQWPLLVAENVPFEAVSAIEERRPRFRRAVVEMRPRRHYPAGEAVAHLVGYTGEVSREELASPAFEGYRGGRRVGKAGIERQYESVLSGQPGVRYVAVNAVGSIVDEFPARDAMRPRPGESLTLGIDLELQEFADSTFPEDRRGGAVALDPRTGEVLLFYSHPSFDPNAFAGGMSTERWRQLNTDPDKPLVNRAVGVDYPPGSTFKLVVSALAMRHGLANIGTHMPTVCDGTLRYGIRTFRCWRREGHGDLPLLGAIRESCNVYFYQLGLRLGMDRLLEGAAELGFSRSTGLDFPSESPGYFPESREWYDRRYGPYGWTESAVLNLAIGQGENQQTLLRQALFYSALATGERPIVPHLARSDRLEERRVPWELEIEEEDRRDLVGALSEVVNEPGGTAYAHRLQRWEMAGKTGTAQNPHGEPHSWFVAFAPVRDPQIVIAAIVEHGHPDNTTSLAVPYAAGIVERYLERHAPEAGGAEGAASSGPEAGGEAGGR